MGIMIPFTLFIVSVLLLEHINEWVSVNTNRAVYSVWYSLCYPQIIVGECFSVYLRSRASFSYEYVACVYKSVGSFVFGAALSQSLTDIAKYSVGRLRPHFLTVCKPNWSLTDCKSGFIENVACTGDPRIINEARWPLPALQILQMWHFSWKTLVGI